ncbi:hypothetical protein [Desulfurivibrio alkaliphilus]|uniref:hypothetical protein n=1 Tax=Desulfurivibrio alkaliphilus TaxID=427923 RepID=UPI0012FEE67D|nr:hypothetical protein [Desulfurivibrio alkaliphilus]
MPVKQKQGKSIIFFIGGSNFFHPRLAPADRGLAAGVRRKAPPAGQLFAMLEKKKAKIKKIIGIPEKYSAGVDGSGYHAGHPCGL